MKSRLLEALCGGIVLAAWILAVETIPRLPARIPIHFGFDGSPNGYGPPATLWLMPAIATVIYGVLSIKQRMPGRHLNLPVTITDRNRDAVYALSREMLPALKLCALLVCAGIEWGAIEAAYRGSIGSSFYALTYVPVALLLGVMIVYTIRMRRV